MSNDAARPAPQPGEEPPRHAAQLKAAIDSGRTGDKAAVSDPAAAPLGTDDEAAGTPPSAAAVAQAHAEEHNRKAKDTRSAELVDNVSPKPGAGVGLMVGVVVALLLAAILGWVLLS